jgi:hypothetical protein
MRVPLGVQVGWGTILKRTGAEMVTDGCFGMAAQLAYYFFLSLFPALLIVVALTSFFPADVLDQTVHWLAVFTPPDVLAIVQGQLKQIQGGGHVSLLTFGVLGALWSSSSAMCNIIDTLNRAYGIKEARPWWKIQLLAIVLTVALSLFVLMSFTLVVAGPEIAEKLAARCTGAGICLDVEDPAMARRFPLDLGRICAGVLPGARCGAAVAVDPAGRAPRDDAVAHDLSGISILRDALRPVQQDVRRYRRRDRPARLVLSIRARAVVRRGIEF